MFAPLDSVRGRVGSRVGTRTFIVWCIASSTFCESPFGDDDLRPEILQRYFIPEDFYEPIYHTSTGEERDGVGIIRCVPSRKDWGVIFFLLTSPSPFSSFFFRDFLVLS